MPRRASSCWCVPASRSSPLWKHQDLVHVLDRREPVRDRDRRAARHQHLQRVADQQLRLGVDARGGLVEDQDRGSNASARANDSSCFCPTDRSRPRSATGLSSPSGSRSMKRSACTARGRAHARRRRCGVAQPDVAGDRPGEQEHVLQHEAEEPAQLRQRHLADVHAVDQDAAARHVVEPQQQADDRRLARAGGPDDADALPRLDRRTTRRAAPSPRPVREPHVLELDPRPASDGTGLRIPIWTARDRLGSTRHRTRNPDSRIEHRRVEQPEDALRRRHRRLQQVELLGQVADRPEEALRVLDERDQRRRA